MRITIYEKNHKNENSDVEKNLKFSYMVIIFFVWWRYYRDVVRENKIYLTLIAVFNYKEVVLYEKR